MNIAIVDDMEEERKRLLEMIKKPFSMYGYAITSIEQFSCSEDFLNEFAANRYDVIFLDIFLGTMNGIEIAKIIRQKDHDVKLVLATASNDFASESYMIRADEYIIKPYSEERLLKMIEHLNLSFTEATRILPFPDGRNAPLRSVLYTSYHGHYVSVYLTTGDIMKIRTSQNAFSDCASLYPEIFSCNKGMLVNLQNVSRLESDYFVMTNGDYIPISRRRLREAKNRYTESLLKKMNPKINA